MRVIYKSSLTPFCQAHIDEINAELAGQDVLASMREIRIFNRDTHTRVSCTFTASHPYYSQIYHSNLYKVSLDGTHIELIGSANRMSTFPEKFNYNEKFISWIHGVADQLTKQRSAYILSNKIKKELIAAVWHPRRVERWLEEGGWDAIDAL